MAPSPAPPGFTDSFARGPGRAGPSVLLVHLPPGHPAGTSAWCPSGRRILPPYLIRNTLARRCMSPCSTHHVNYHLDEPANPARDQRASLGCHRIVLLGQSSARLRPNEPAPCATRSRAVIRAWWGSPDLCPADALDDDLARECTRERRRCSRNREAMHPGRSCLLNAGTAVRPPKGGLSLVSGVKMNPAREPARPGLASLSGNRSSAMEKVLPHRCTSWGGQRWPILGSRGCPVRLRFLCSPRIWGRRVRFPLAGQHHR